MENINWLSMGIATITPMVIGFFYYHKAAFGRIWQDSISRSENKPSKVIMFSILIVFSFFLSFFLLNFNNDGINQEGSFDTFQHGAWHGTFVAITVVAPVIVATTFFARKPLKNMFINIVYWIITLAIMGGTLDAMNHWENVIIP